MAKYNMRFIANISGQTFNWRKEKQCQDFAQRFFAIPLWRRGELAAVKRFSVGWIAGRRIRRLSSLLPLTEISEMPRGQFSHRRKLHITLMALEAGR